MKGDLNRLKEAKVSKKSTAKMKSRFGKSFKSDQPDTVNSDGYPAYLQDSYQEFIRTAMCNIVKNQYYMDKAIAQSEAVHILSIFPDKEFALKTAVYARSHGMKLMPKMIIASLSRYSEFCEKHEKTIVKLLSTYHPSQLHEYLEIQKSKAFGKGLGKVQQRWIREAVNLWSNERQEEYSMKFTDDFRLIQTLTHPSKFLPLTKYLFDRKPVTARQKALQKLKTLKDDNKFLEIMVDNEIPFEAVKAFIPQTAKAYFAMMMNSGVQGVLLNTVSYINHGVFKLKGAVERYEMALSPENVRKSRILPLDIIKPIIMVGSHPIKQSLIRAFVAAFDNVPSFEGKRVAVSIDQSGSMQGEPLILAGAFAGMFIGEDASNLWLSGFDTSIWNEGDKFLPQLTGIPREEMYDRLFQLGSHGGTDTSLAVDTALRRNEKFDLFVIITDEQQNTGNRLYSVFKQYRQSINGNAKLMIVNSASLPWSSVPSGAENVVVYPTMTSTVFENIHSVCELESIRTQILEVKI